MEYDKVSQKSSEPEQQREPVEQVTATKGRIPKKGLGQKFKETFLDLEFIKGLAKHAYKDMILPNGRRLIWDIGNEIWTGYVFKGSTNPQRFLDPQTLLSRFTMTSYNQPVNFQQGGLPSNMGALPPAMSAPQPTQGPRRAQGPSTESLLVDTAVEAELVLGRMNERMETYNVVSVGDMLEAAGMMTQPQDYKWGWVYLGDAKVRQVPTGYMLTFSKAQPINTL